MEGTAIILLCSCLLSNLIFNSAADTLTANQTIRDGQTIVSASGEFEMGFFSTKGNPKNRYFGIWYKKISNGTVVWVANRETPIANTSGIIRVSSRGIVLSINQSTESIWTSNSTRSVKNPVAQLFDTGNLVFRDENGQQDFVWQSFDQPVDTFLPGMKLGYDLVTGADRYFLPWKSDDDPTPGNYTCRVDKNGFPQLLLWKDSVLWYRNGPWVGSTLSGLSLQNSNEIYRESFVITETKAYYVFDILISESPIAKLTLTPRGVLTRYIWNREENDWALYYKTLEDYDCERYGLCGTNGVCSVHKSPMCKCMEGFHPKSPEDWAEADWSNGCLRNVQLECGNGEGFVKHSGLKLPDTRWSWYNMSMNLPECRDQCLKDCNCTAYSNTDTSNGGSGCLLWFGSLDDMQSYSEDGQDLYVKMAASELKENRKLRAKLLKIVLVPLLVILTVMISFSLLYAYRTKRLKSTGKEKTLAGQDLDLPLFSFMQIAKATDNFSSKRQIGKGGFGTVYKGILEEGQEIAVKRLSKDSRQGLDEFMNEVSCIAKLQHRNLVMLLGCCIEEGERLLIYEYLPNKSLDYYIFGMIKTKASLYLLIAGL